MSLAADQVEHGEAVAIGDNRLTIDQKRWQRDKQAAIPT
jgi:hypothetical protein